MLAALHLLKGSARGRECDQYIECTLYLPKASAMGWREPPACGAGRKEQRRGCVRPPGLLLDSSEADWVVQREKAGQSFPNAKWAACWATSAWSIRLHLWC